jgi:hypothetical protein
MTVKQLKEKLKGVDENMTVYLLRDSAIGGFAFSPACPEETGVCEFGPPDEASGEVGNQGFGFCIMPHGATAEEDDENETDELPPLLN